MLSRHLTLYLTDVTSVIRWIGSYFKFGYSHSGVEKRISRTDIYASSDRQIRSLDKLIFLAMIQLSHSSF
uniref:Uncharacterized protein n=1 Tax=Arundo donax TaxID=35708 RepID=A0A0A9CFE9_ARUDO